MIPKQDLKLFLAGLKHVQENGPEWSDIGICGNLPDEDYEDYGPYDLMEHYSPQWKHFSGDPTYPIPRINRSSYLWKGKSGLLRYELIDFLVATVAKELEEQNA